MCNPLRISITACKKHHDRSTCKILETPKRRRENDVNGSQKLSELIPTKHLQTIANSQRCQFHVNRCVCHVDFTRHYNSRRSQRAVAVIPSLLAVLASSSGSRANLISIDFTTFYSFRLNKCLHSATILRPHELMVKLIYNDDLILTRYVLLTGVSSSWLIESVHIYRRQSSKLKCDYAVKVC